MVQTADQVAINKIMGGGITFLIQTLDKKTDKDGMIINYPVYSKNSHVLFSFHHKGEIPVVLSPAAADSNMHFNNHKMNANAKSIRIVGIKDMDSLISIYNDEGIKAAQLFNNKNVYTCEIAIALKNLGFSASNPTRFRYHILLNSGPNKTNGMNYHFTAPEGSSPEAHAMMEKMTAMTNNIEADLYSTTGFWGEYTLIN